MLQLLPQEEKLNKKRISIELTINLEAYLAGVDFSILDNTNDHDNETYYKTLRKLNNSELIFSFSSINLKHRATSINGTKLFICLPPANNFIVPSWEAIFENKLGIISILIVSEE